MTATTSLHIPPTAQLLDAWERALADHAGERALRVLEVMCDDGGERLDHCSPGQLNRLVLAARSVLFGDTCDTVAECPGCCAHLEASIPLAELANDESTGPAARELTLGQLRVIYRLPTWRELCTLTDQSVDSAAGELLESCVTSIESGAGALVLSDVDTSTRQAIDEAICAADVDALIEVQLSCPECGQTACLPMDPGSFLWDELNRWALTTLSEVAELAVAFGWSQADILAMTPWRRQAYLSLAAPMGRQL